MYRRPTLAWIAALALLSPAAYGGKHGFADKPGGGKNDPVIVVSASVAPNTGERFSRTEEEANAGYSFLLGRYAATPPPTIPRVANGANQFIQIKFPFKISSKKTVKTIMKSKASFASTSFLTPNVVITDDTGLHVRGIPTIGGKDVNGNKLKNHPNFPTWLNGKGKNLLVDKKALTYIADDGDGDLATPAAFGSNAADPDTSNIEEVRIRIDAVDGVTINGFWVLKMDDGAGAPSAGSPMMLDDVIPTDPVTPAKKKNGNDVVETFSKYWVRFSEPVVPWSVGFSAESVKALNATNIPVPLIYNGNTGPVTNPLDLTHPLFPNNRVTGNPPNVTTYAIPFDVRPINPNNLSEYVVNPLLDAPEDVPINVTSFALAINTNIAAGGQVVASAVTSLYDVVFNDQTATATRTFHSGEGRSFVNAPVSPHALYYAPTSGTGLGVINLDGNGFETNDPSTERLILMTSGQVMCQCFALFNPNTSFLMLAGSHLQGCNGNTFGDFTGQNPIGIAGNPPGTPFGPSTPVPGVNEGSSGTTANGSNPFGVFPPGFETVVKDSNGNPRLVDSPVVGSVSDMQLGEFLDVLYFDSQNVGVNNAVRASIITGQPITRNSMSDPPVPNPPPLRLPVGLPPVDIVFNQQKLLKPAFVIEGDEVWTQFFGSCLQTPPMARILLSPNPTDPGFGDVPSSFPQNGPFWQSFGAAAGTGFTARQQIGNFLYVADRDNGGVTVLNSNTFSVIDRINVPDAQGLGIAPNNARLYVSNFGQNSVSIIGTDPLGANFHKEIARINVGEGPRTVTVQPDNEDVLIANYLDNSMSILDVSSLTVRKTIKSGLKRPIDIVATPRMTIFGWLAGLYLGYVASEGSDTVLMFESGPDGPSGVGLDDIRWALSGPPLADIRGMVYDSGNIGPVPPVNLQGQLIFADPRRTGVYVAHRDAETGSAMISRIVFTQQLPAPGIIPPIALPGSILTSPGTVQRVFEVVAFWGGPLAPANEQLNKGGQDQQPFDVAIADSSMASFHAPPLNAANAYKTNFGGWPFVLSVGAGTNNSHSPIRVNNGAPFETYLADRMYLSFPGDNRIVVLDPQNGGVILNTIEGVPAVGKMTTYFDP